MNRHLGLFLLTVLTTHRGRGAQSLHSASQPAFAARAFARLPGGSLALGGLWFSVPFLGFLTRARVRPLRHGPLARPAAVATLLPAGPRAADRVARRGHRLPRPFPQPAGAVRLRRRRADRRLRRRRCRARRAACAWSPIVKLAEQSGSLARRSADVPVARRRSSSVRCRDGYVVSLHPTAFAGWLGLLFTMMNLVPISQLDGGHIAYAALRRHSRWVTSPARGRHVGRRRPAAPTRWSLWLVLLLVMMRLIGWEHPPARRRRPAARPRAARRSPPSSWHHGRLLHAGAASPGSRPARA